MLKLTLQGSLVVTLAAAIAGCGSDDDPISQGPAPLGGVTSETVDLASAAKPARTPGTKGVEIDAGSKLAQQFGTTAVDLNKARYVRYALEGQQEQQPDAVFVAVPGTLGGAHNYWVLADNLMRKAKEEHDMVLEVWAFERRTNLLEDTVGLDVAEQVKDYKVALDFLYGNELGLELSPELEAGPGRRALFHDSTEVAFMANWTPQVHSLDIDAVVEEARSRVRNGNVFLGGHSAGTGFTARYAATDFNLAGEGEPEPGYAKLRGLVLLEGAGGSLSNSAPTEEELDAVINQADGGLYAAVAGGAAPAYLSLPDNGLTPRTSASTEVSGMQMEFEGTINGSQAALQQDQNGSTGNNVYNVIEGFSERPYGLTAGAALGTYLDDDNYPEPNFVAASMGAVGPEEEGLVTWLDNDQELPNEAFESHGPKPALLTERAPWGTESEPTNLQRLAPSFFQGRANYSDWYYPSTALSVGSDLGLDTSALSLPEEAGGRGRADIVNQTQAQKIDIPVIGFGGSNGLVTVPGVFQGFATAIAPCAAPSCDGTTIRLPAGTSNNAFPDFGGAPGGFEVHMSEGYSHMDVLTANADDPSNNVVEPLVQFLVRNSQ